MYTYKTRKRKVHVGIILQHKLKKNDNYNIFVTAQQ